MFFSEHSAVSGFRNNKVQSVISLVGATALSSSHCFETGGCMTQRGPSTVSCRGSQETLEKKIS